jgi:NO-binding membrane sensor protein with MHYT domain
MSDATNAESSLLMWLVAAAVAVLAAHVCLGWLRHGIRQGGGWRRWPAWLIASMTLGTGLCATTVLALSGEALAFAVGYRLILALLLWLAAIGGSLLLCAVLLFSQRSWLLLGLGLLLGASATVLQWGWFTAAGFRPGLVWRYEFPVAAGILMAVCTGAALWMSFSEAGQNSNRRTLWRVGSAFLLGGSIIAGQQLLSLGAGLPTQVGSVYQRELPGSILGLVCGVLLPLVLVVMALDLLMRQKSNRRSSRDAGANFAPRKRRKRRHRIRTL